MRYPIQGLANRTAEKVKPSALDMTLLFREAVRVKRLATPGVSVRDLLNSVVSEYNRTITTKEGYQSKEGYVQTKIFQATYSFQVLGGGRAQE